MMEMKIPSGQSTPFKWAQILIIHEHMYSCPMEILITPQNLYPKRKHTNLNVWDSFKV